MCLHDDGFFIYYMFIFFPYINIVKQFVKIKNLIFILINNYENVSIRDIAHAANVKVPTIYNHFASKEAILQSLYSFYEEHCRQAKPDIHELLRLVDTEPPYKVLLKANFHFDPEIQQTLNRIFALAARDINFKRSEKFIQDHLFKTVIDLLRPLLESMVERKRIEPLNIDLFLCLVTKYAFSASFLSGTPFQISLETWFAGLDMLYSLVRPTDKEHRNWRQN